MKKIIYTTFITLSALCLHSCDFLDEDAQGILSEEQAKAPASIDGLVTAAYSSLGNDHYDKPFSLWPYGTVRSDDAYKGGNDENDIVNFHFYEISENIKTDFGEADGLWFFMYQAISRTNSALAVLKNVDPATYNLKDTRMGEMYFLRGHFYFMLKIVFGRIPFVDEDMPIEEYDKVPNTLTTDEQWALICADFKKAYDLLPTTQSQVGRANKIAAAAYLAKAYLYKAYRQDDPKKNELTAINADDLTQVLAYTQIAMNSSYGLESDMACNFLPGAYQNGRESLFAIQYSIDDGTMFGRLNWGDVLSVPMGVGCCDFHKPSQNLVNAYKTVGGLPNFDGYDNSNYQIGVDKADPRLYHTVALPGVPYKYNEELVYEENWNRNPNTYGIYASLKENVDPSCDCFKNVSPFYGNSKNRIVIRYADVVLMRAEALIELNRESEALSLINLIRERAQNSTVFIPYAKNLQVDLYKDGVNCTWSNDFARQALRWERRLEFAMEGSRFFDLVRWGVVTETMNAFFRTESARRSFLGSGKFDKNQDEYIPIPQQQISFTNGIYQQNPGW
ncbi:RagB/SusD family nutrient uptake outer membrane protein [Bacteroides sp. 51]|uniref:RagB/SusD family nutrient uptake outer membrane protein n=1 Tax=Bacteroides sp. 51 TaxID=2302938 RepID=UPI0013D4665C|nr:RagB/SusD family nutrient uptake outer membrane protein [Bacteroides sp. 51]NDV82782.1 RagB/SusD family nutrient uptake outer membrane protein [Bacteroides sp. 51]